jgi:hypothetical protein
MENAINLHRGYRNFFVCKNAHRGFDKKYKGTIYWKK